jgi:hypothetical protein
MADTDNTTPQPEPTPQQVEVAQTWNAVLLAATRRIMELERGQADLQTRLAKLEALLTGGGTAN